MDFRLEADPMLSVVIPESVVDLPTFRAWAHSDAYPERGRFAFLDGILWVDLGGEDLFAHNQVAIEARCVLGGIVDAEELGYLFVRGALLSNTIANFATEPDAFFCSYDSIRSGRIRFVKGRTGDYMEVEGTPDAVLEIVGAGSVKKDTEVLPTLYWRAGVPEFWLVDARPEEPRLQIFRHGATGYEAQPTGDKGMFSAVFSRQCRLTRELDRAGNPSFNLVMER